MQQAFVIRIDDLTSAAVAELLQGHLASAAEHSPEGKVHALDLDGLRQPDVTFWTVWQQDEQTAAELMGCGALRELDATHGELKSMRTATVHLRKGVAAALLTHMIETATRRGYRRLSLETGNTEGFAAARALYDRFGFERCQPFGSYVDDGFSICMTRRL